MLAFGEVLDKFWAEKTWHPLDDGEYTCVKNYVVLDGDKLIACYKGGTITIVLPDNLRLCAMENDAIPGPDWSQAPEWAMWWTVDPNGWACWYQEEPILSLTVSYSGWMPKTFHGVKQGNLLWAQELDIPLGIDWRTLKAQRPQETI